MLNAKSSRKRTSQNYWSKEAIRKFLDDSNLPTPEELPPIVPQHLLEELIDRGPVSIWRYVKSGKLPPPSKIAA